jgi:hypothetical protein
MYTAAEARFAAATGNDSSFDNLGNHCVHFSQLDGIEKMIIPHEDQARLSLQFFSKAVLCIQVEAFKISSMNVTVETISFSCRTNNKRLKS